MSAIWGHIESDFNGRNLPLTPVVKWKASIMSDGSGRPIRNRQYSSWHLQEIVIWHPYLGGTKKQTFTI